MTKKSFILLFGVIAAIGLGFIGFYASKPAPNGGEQVTADTPAFLVYKDNAYLPFNSEADNQLKADVGYFARKSFSVYNTDSTDSIVLNINKAPITKGATTTITGTYEKSKDTINITVILLKNARIKDSITDAATGANLDTLLPSNSTRNQFIGTLPINSGGYSIDYLTTTDQFLITLYDTSAQSDAVNVLKSGLKTTVLSNTDYQIITPSSGGQGAPN